MKHIRHKIKKHHIISAFAVGGLAAAMFSFNSQPIFDNTDNFVLFAQEEIKLEQGVQVSSGDLGSNGKIDIEKDSIINGNLFAKEISIDKNTIINGNASFNKLKLHKDAQILGTQTKPVQLPIANLPEIPDFQVGTQDFKFEGQDNTLAAGSYRNITLEKNSRLILEGGIYNLRMGPKTGREDDDDEINSLHDDKEKKDHKARKIGRPALFGKNSFLNFKLLALKASVHIGKESTLRGQVLARKIRIGKDSILSREEIFEKESDPTKLIAVDGVEFMANEIILLLTSASDISEAAEVAKFVGGSVTGSVSSIGLYKIEVNTNTATELQDVIGSIESASFSFVLSVSENALMAPR